jgi:hypothetical protein
MSLSKAKQQIAELEHFQARANKLRNKRGRMEISRETFADLERIAGRKVEHTRQPDELISVAFEEYVAAVDAAVEAFGL